MKCFNKTEYYPLHHLVVCIIFLQPHPTPTTIPPHFHVLHTILNTWWDPQQFAETSPGGHTEDPKRDPKQDMDLCRFSSTVESSNGDPNPQTK